MATTTLKMSLRTWDLTTDPYDHDQLADNLSKIDQHDHTPGRGVLIPTEGIADGAITTEKLAAGIAGLDGLALANTFRPIHWVSNNAAGVSPVYLSPQGAATPQAGVSNNAFYFDPADYAIPGRATRLRIRATAVNNAVVAGATYTFQLVKGFTIFGTSSNFPQITSGSGTAVDGTAVSVTPGSALTLATNVSAEFIAPDVGWYLLVVTHGSMAAGSFVALNAELQLRWS